MPKKTLTNAQIKEIVDLRQTGHSLTEIKQKTKRANSTILKYIQDVVVLPEYKDILKSKQGGSKERSRIKWDEAKESAATIVGKLSDRDIMMFMAGIYWGEGTKKDFNLINGDPYLIRIFINSLNFLGVKKEDIKLSFRVFNGMNKDEIIDFWLKFLGMDIGQVTGCEIVRGSDSKRLIHGMCRVRVRKGGKYFKLIMSMIDFIKHNDKMPS